MENLKAHNIFHKWIVSPPLLFIWVLYQMVSSKSLDYHMIKACFVLIYFRYVFWVRMYLNQFTSKSIQIYAACIFCMRKYVYTQIFVCTKPKLEKVVSVATHHSFDCNFSDVEFFFLLTRSFCDRVSFNVQP